VWEVLEEELASEDLALEDLAEALFWLGCHDISEGAAAEFVLDLLGHDWRHP
jgi:hypothetical protein